MNEADYARMWVQAATTMTTYQAVSESALAAVPTTTPAPQILVADAATSTDQHGRRHAAAATYPSWMDQLAQWLQQYTSNFAWPVSKDLNPGGWPFPPVPWVNSLSSMFTQLGLSPTLATALGWAIFHTLMIFYPFIQTAIQLAVVAVVPAMVVVAAAAAAGVAAGAATAIGIAVPAAIPPPLPAAAPAPMPTAPAPPVSSSVPASVSSTAAPSPATPRCRSRQRRRTGRRRARRRLRPGQFDGPRRGYVRRPVRRWSVGAVGARQCQQSRPP